MVNREVMVPLRSPPGLDATVLGFWDEGLTPTKDGGTCLKRLSMFRKEVH